MADTFDDYVEQSLKNMLTFDDILVYECLGTWWSGYMHFGWLSSIGARIITKRCEKKYKRYIDALEHKLKYGTTK